MARILIADDSSQILQAFRKALEEHPEWKVCGEASNGIEVVAQSAALNPDVVVVDLTMPRMNGFEAARTHVRTIAADSSATSSRFVWARGGPCAAEQTCLERSAIRIAI